MEKRLLASDLYSYLVSLSSLLGGVGETDAANQALGRDGDRASLEHARRSKLEPVARSVLSFSPAWRRDGRVVEGFRASTGRGGPYA